MASDFIQRQVTRFLNEAEAALGEFDWEAVRQRAEAILALDPDNKDAKALIAAAERAREAKGAQEAEPSQSTSTTTERAAKPTSFANGRYEVRRFLGEGGKKRVYLAHDAQLDRDVAFALIKTEGLDEAARQRITREAQAMGRLGSHPHIVTVYDIGEENGQPYLVLPVLPGGDVEGVIEDAPDHKLSIEQAVKIATETCLGLEFSHSKGIIHRDLKPGNVWLAEDGRAMIGDFGLAVAVDRSRLTQAGMMVGTVNYMPPEQAMGGEVTPQSDLYSLGAMLYEMVCGRPPFVGDESVAIIGQHLNTPPVAPTWHRPDCPPGLEALILRLLEKDAGKRPSSATEVLEALANIESSVGVVREPPPPGTLSETPRPSVDPLYRRTFVGRENETRQLHQAYDAAVSGQGGLVMIAGEPGIGKTALCEQLETYVSLRGGKTLFGHCYEEGSMSLPYLAFVEAMRSYVLDRDPDALRTELGSGASEVARIVSEVRDKVTVELRDASDPEDDRWRLLNAITTFLRNAAQVQPLVIVLEDLHWADRGTLDLLLHVARNLEAARLLVVGTYRDVEVDRQHPLSATLADLRRVSTFLRIPLRGLTVDEVHRMYEAIRGNTVPRGQAEAVYRATEGNPLFVQEILRYLVEEGLVVRQDGQYVALTPGEGVPEGLRDVVGRRLGHLSESANQVLSTASVIGRDFRLDVLQQVAGLPEEKVLQALEEATERSIIEQRQSVGTLAFRFTHAFFRQVLYEEIFAARQIRWHQQVARALETAFGTRSEEHAAELADHYAHSTDPEDLRKAVEYGRLAAQKSMSVFAYEEAVGHLEQAVKAQEVLDDADKATRCDLLMAMADALNAGGMAQKVRESVAPAALDLAESLEDPVRASRICQQAITAIGNQQAAMGWQSSEARRWAELADRFAVPESFSRVLADVALAMTIRSGAIGLGLQPSSDEWQQALDLLVGARDLARRLNDNAAMWIADVQSLQAMSTPKELDSTLALAREVASRSRQGASQASLRQSFIYCVDAFLLSGLRAEAERLIEELADLAERTKDPNLESLSMALRAVPLMLDGNLEAVADVGKRIVVHGREANLPRYASANVGVYIARALQYLGDETLLEAAETDLLNILRDQLRPTEQTLVRLDAAVKRPASVVPVSGLCTQLTAALAVGHQPYLRYALAAFEGTDVAVTGFGVPSLACVERLLGDASLQLAEPKAARTHYEKASNVCERVRHRPDMALTRLSLAELLLDHYPEEHDAAIEHLDFAIAEFQDMKMQPALERALGRRGLLKA